MEISEIRNQIAQNTEKMASFRDNLDLDRLEEEIALLDHDMSAPSFWDDNIAAQKIVEQSNQLKAKYETFMDMQAMLDDQEVKAPTSTATESMTWCSETSTTRAPAMTA